VSKASHRKVLYIDDDIDDRFLLSTSFAEARAKADLVCTSGPEEAFSYLNSLDENSLPSLIVLDLNMPKINGRETLSYLKSTPAFADIPVVILSTSSSNTEKEACKNLGAASYVEKPMHMSGYVDMVRNFISLMKITD
jgi:two-component system response regulator